MSKKPSELKKLIQKLAQEAANSKGADQFIVYGKKNYAFLSPYDPNDGRKVECFKPSKKLNP